MAERKLEIPTDKLHEAEALAAQLSTQDIEEMLTAHEQLAKKVKDTLAKRAGQLDNLGIFPTELFSYDANEFGVESPALFVSEYPVDTREDLLINNKGRLIICQYYLHRLPVVRIEDSVKRYNTITIAHCNDGDYLLFAGLALGSMADCIKESLPQAEVAK